MKACSKHQLRDKTPDLKLGQRNKDDEQQVPEGWYWIEEGLGANVSGCLDRVEITGMTTPAKKVNRFGPGW
jgi:hypothetical protein